MDPQFDPLIGIIDLARVSLFVDLIAILWKDDAFEESVNVAATKEHGAILEDVQGGTGATPCVLGVGVPAG